MEIVPYEVPVTDAADPDYMAPKVILASLNKANRVKLRLMHGAFDEACQVVGNLTVQLAKDAEEQPWLDMQSVGVRKGLALLLDIYNSQMVAHAMSPPDLVTLTLSRCEALELWELWMLLELEASQVPGFAAVMHELHHLLC